jgi:hypothetical protein
MIMRAQYIWLLTAVLAVPMCAGAQWLNFRDSTVPRTRDGEPNLSAPVHRLNGKPDLSGIWEVESSPRKQLEPYLLPGGVNGLGEDDPSIYFINFFYDFSFGKEPFQPEAATRFQQQMHSNRKPPTLCMPPSLPVADLVPAPFKIVQTPRMLLILYEADTVFRQIFTDGRKLPNDPQPSWLGYSVGKWEGDSLVVETIGFNERGTLDAMGHFHSETMRVTERMHRRDFGHMEMELTVADSKTYTQPVTVRVNFRLLPDTELLESFCSEAEHDLAHLPGN